MIRAVIAGAACPRCKGKLAEDSSAKWLRCDACGLVYPIRGGFPILLPEAALPSPGTPQRSEFLPPQPPKVTG
jgi:uncharacterized protein YbaR (Trm112 family)